MCLPFMSEEEIFDSIKALLVDRLQLEPEEIHLEANLMDDLDVDSLLAAEIAMSVEDDYDLQINNEELANLKTVTDIINLVKVKLAN